MRARHRSSPTHRRSGAALLATFALVLSLTAPGPARAADPPTGDTISIPIGGADGTDGSLVVNKDDGTIVQTVKGINNVDIPPAPQCLAQDVLGADAGDSTLCFGGPTTIAPDGSLTVDGTLCAAGAVNLDPAHLGACVPLLGGRKDVQDALGWLVAQARTAVSVLYDVPDDDRIDTYARPEIRAYVIEALLNIMDKYVAGQTLSPDEQKALDFVLAEDAAEDSAVSRFALDEYTEYSQNPCGYQPPPAPPGTKDPVGLPESVTDACARAAAGGFAQIVGGMIPPTPSADDFRTWGGYRHTAELGLTVDPVLAHEMSTSIAAALGASAAAATAGAGVVGGTAIAAGVAIDAFQDFVITVFPFATRGVLTGVGVALGGAAGVASGVLLFVTGTAFALAQIIDAKSVGETLRKAVASDENDPIGLDALRAKGGAPAPGTCASSSNPPGYKMPSALLRLTQQVTQWLEGRSDGSIVPDPTGVWPHDATAGGGYQFHITSTDGTDITRNFIELPQPPDDSGQAVPPLTVHISDGWLVTSPKDDPTQQQAALQVEYVDADGNTQVVSRKGTNAFAQTSVDSPGCQGTVVSELHYRSPDGSLVTVTLVPPPPLGKLVPTAGGVMVPGRVVHVNANPLDTDGNFAADQFQTGFQFSWKLLRRDPDTGAQVVVQQKQTTTPVTSFTPADTGVYLATVVLHDPSGTLPDTAGYVEFTVNPPTLNFTITDQLPKLVDDAVGHLRLDAQITANTPDDDFTATVQWPGRLGSDQPGASDTQAVTCVTQDADSCVSPVPGGADSARFDHDLNPADDLSQGAQLTVTDKFGAQLSRTFHVISGDRPSFGPPPPPPPTGQRASVSFIAASSSLDENLHLVFTPTVVDVQLPVAGGSGSREVDLAGIRPGAAAGAGATFTLRDPDSPSASTIQPIVGDPSQPAVTAEIDGDLLLLRSDASFADIGEHDVPLVVQESDGTLRALLLRIDIVPAADNKYRGIAGGSVSPDTIPVVATLPALAPFVMGGLAKDGSYTGEVCVELDHLANNPSECKPAATFVAADGTVQPFPYADLYPQGLPQGIYHLLVSLPTGDRNDTAPTEVSFVVPSDPPVVHGLTWNRPKQTVSFTTAAGQPAPDESAAPVTATTCTLDGHPVDCAGGSFDTTGLAPGQHVFTVLVTDGRANFTTASIPLEVPEALTVTTTTLPHAQVGAAYRAVLHASGGDGGSHTWSVTAGSLPDGLELSSDGVLSGTPTTAGQFAFTVSVDDPAVASLTLVVDPAPAAPATPAGAASQSAAQLASTGFATLPWLTAGALLLLAGLLLAAGARRRWGRA